MTAGNQQTAALAANETLVINGVSIDLNAGMSQDQVINRKVDQVKNTIQRMLDDGIREREHVFW